MTCQHCGEDRIHRARGLCWGCWYSPSVRERYGESNQYGRRGIANGHRNGTTPDPTNARPGTDAKLAVLEMRAANGQMLWHPADATN